MCDDFALDFGYRKNWLMNHDNAPSHTYSFARTFLTKNNITVVPHPPYSSLCPRLQINLKGLHCYTIEIIEAKSREVLISLTEHDLECI
jgi:hypothetical protein